MIFNDSHHSRVHFRPGMGSAAWFSTIGAAALYLFEECESRDFEGIEHILYPFSIGLIEYYKYTFHRITKLTILFFSRELHENKFLVVLGFFISFTMS